MLLEAIDALPSVAYRRAIAGQGANPMHIVPVFSHIW